jgi:3-oxoacyl-[acyl-carrier protein] reductase
MKMDSAMREFDPIHILVNNTGGPPPGPASDATRDAFESAFRQHLICNQILTQAVLPGMKREKYGRIVNIISTSVKQPIPGLGVSNTIRGAVASWAKTLSVELAPFGITVNNVLPGATRTQRLASLIAKKAAESHRTVADVEAEMMEEIPAKRFAEPAEVAHAIAFLASPAAAYINGINVPVDGGRTGSL